MLGAVKLENKKYGNRQILNFIKLDDMYSEKNTLRKIHREKYTEKNTLRKIYYRWHLIQKLYVICSNTTEYDLYL